MAEIGKKNQENSKQRPEAKLSYLRIIYFLHLRYHPNIIGYILKNKQKNKCVCIHKIIRLIIVKIKMKMKNRSYRYKKKKIDLGLDMDRNKVNKKSV